MFTPCTERKGIDHGFQDGIAERINVLEKAEELSPEGRRFLIEELKKQISRSICFKNQAGFSPFLPACF
jgi:hypothetical protein